MSKRGKKKRLWRQAEEARQKKEDKFYQEISHKLKRKIHGWGKCSHCQKIYPFDIWHEQGDGFASDAYASGVFCGYGSKFDMSIFLWTQGQKTQGQICDECIDQLVLGEYLRYIGDMIFASDAESWYDQLSMN